MMRRGITGLSALLLFALFAVAGVPPAVVAAEQTPNKIVSYETFYGSLDPDGSLRSARLVNQLRVIGTGDFRIVDPSSTEGFRNLTGSGSATVGDDAIEWEVAGVEGSEEMVSVTTPDVSSPLEMLVTYMLDGERIEGGDLPGKSGSVQLVFDVRNTTSEPTEITYEDGTGNETTVTEDVPIPIVAELTLTLPKGTFTEVDAPGADVVTAPNGDLTVRWSMVLIPPIGDVTQTFSLTAKTEDFRLGQVRLVGAPVAPKDRPFLFYAEEELEGGVDSASSLYGGSSTLSSNIDRLHDGAVELLDGMQRLFDGSKELQEGLIDGAGRVGSGLQEAATGSSTLTSGLGDAVSGSSQITGGLRELSSGMKRILGGLKTLARGLPDAQGGAMRIAEAAQLLDAGLATIRSGLQLAQSGAADIAAGADAIAACLTGPGTPCSGNPSVSAIAGQIAAGAGDIAAGAGAIGAAAGDIGSGAAGISGAAGNLEGACVADSGGVVTECPTVAGIAAGIQGGAAAIQGGAAAIQGGATQIQGGAGGIQAIVAGLSANLGTMSVGANSIAVGLGDAVNGIGLPGDAPTASIRGGLRAIRVGALQLASGIGDAIAGIGDAMSDNTLVGGMSRAMAGADLLTAGSARLTSGLGEAHAGSGRLTAGLNTAASEIPEGMRTAADGARRLHEGIGEAKDGTQQIEQNLYLVNEVGVREIARSASAKVAEIDRQLQLLEAQDARAEAESVLYGPPSSDQAETVIGGSSVVLTLDALDGRTAASTTRGVSAGIALVLLAAIALGLGAFRRRPVPAA